MIRGPSAPGLRAATWLRVSAALFSAGVLLASGTPAVHAGEPPLVRARTLLEQGRFAQARETLRAGASALAPAEREVAALITGRSLLREAELYHWVHWAAAEIGRDYLAELSAATPDPKPASLVLFSGLYAMAAEDYAAAERTLARAAGARDLPAPWPAVAKLRGGVAAHWGAPGAPANVLGADASPEAHYWRAVLGRSSEVALPARAASEGIERLWLACALLREGRAGDADALLADVDLDRPAVEQEVEPGKILRFYDPLVLAAQARALFERTKISLETLAAEGHGPRAGLAALYVAQALHQVGDVAGARAHLARARGTELGADLTVRRAVLTAATGESPPPAAAAKALLAEAMPHPDAVLLWADLGARTVPAGERESVLAGIEAAVRGSGDRAMAGRWGLSRLRAGADASAVLNVLARLRDNASKNRIEQNDPLLLLAIAMASYRTAAYAESLETVWALSQAYPGLRGVHWNLQGTYAARQRAGGEARISP